jgi:hypothetical protein
VDFSLALAYPSRAMGPREELPLYRDWLTALFQPLPEPVQVVFDGLDRLAPQAPAFRFLQVCLELAPPHLRLFMLSRELPPLQLEALKMRQEASPERTWPSPERGPGLLDAIRFHLSAELLKTMHQHRG